MWDLQFIQQIPFHVVSSYWINMLFPATNPILDFDQYLSLFRTKTLSEFKTERPVSKPQCVPRKLLTKLDIVLKTLLKYHLALQFPYKERQCQCITLVQFRYCIWSISLECLLASVQTSATYVQFHFTAFASNYIPLQ